MNKSQEPIPKNRWQSPCINKPVITMPCAHSGNILPCVPDAITIISTPPEMHIVDGTTIITSERCYAPNHSVSFEAHLNMKGKRYDKSYW